MRKIMLLHICIITLSSCCAIKYPESSLRYAAYTITDSYFKKNLSSVGGGDSYNRTIPRYILYSQDDRFKPMKKNKVFLDVCSINIDKCLKLQTTKRVHVDGCGDIAHCMVKSNIKLVILRPNAILRVLDPKGNISGKAEIVRKLGDEGILNKITYDKKGPHYLEITTPTPFEKNLKYYLPIVRGNVDFSKFSENW